VVDITKKTKKQKNIFSRASRVLYKNQNSQIMVLTGIILVVIVIFVSTLAPDVVNISVDISNVKARSEIESFLLIKRNLPYIITFDLAENITIEKDSFIFYGNISNLSCIFNNIINETREIKFKQGINFDGKLNNYWVAHPGSKDGVYYLDVTVSIGKKDEYHEEDMIISIVCSPT
jgi:hypothetical protein